MGSKSYKKKQSPIKEKIFKSIKREQSRKKDSRLIKSRDNRSKEAFYSYLEKLASDYKY